jgi:hypothetical protein
VVKSGLGKSSSHLENAYPARETIVVTPTGEWKCSAVWKTDGKLFQEIFRYKLDDPEKTILS